MVLCSWFPFLTFDPCWCSVPIQAGYLKAIMQAAADVATTRFSDLANNSVEVIGARDVQNTVNDHMFTLFDKNNDGVISMDEFKDVIGELGGDGEDAHELMKLVDSNFDGSVSQEEFKDFRRQVIMCALVFSHSSFLFGTRH